MVRGIVLIVLGVALGIFAAECVVPHAAVTPFDRCMQRVREVYPDETRSLLEIHCGIDARKHRFAMQPA